MSNFLKRVILGFIVEFVFSQKVYLVIDFFWHYRNYKIVLSLAFSFSLTALMFIQIWGMWFYMVVIYI